MDYLGELVWRKENKKDLIISMKKVINVYSDMNIFFIQ